MLKLIPISLSDANAFVAAHHRHHKPVRGHKFSLGCEQDGVLVGVAIVGRPVSRYLDDGNTLEVNRLCTTGEKNACSFLYGAAARAARALGYGKIITYILDTESGVSLRAAGWTCAGLAGGKCWTGQRKPKTEDPKITRLREEHNKNKEKISELQARNRDLEKQIRELENTDIVGMVRAKGLSLEDFATSFPRAVSASGSHTARRDAQRKAGRQRRRASGPRSESLYQKTQIA